MRNHNLRAHMKAHAGEYNCEICNKPFSNKYNRSVHMLGVHNIRAFDRKT